MKGKIDSQAGESKNQPGKTDLESRVEILELSVGSLKEQVKRLKRSNGIIQDVN